MHRHYPAAPSRWRSPLGIFMLAAGALGIYYLLTEHLTHVAQAIPYWGVNSSPSWDTIARWSCHAAFALLWDA
jgi:hypothetical protein